MNTFDQVQELLKPYWLTVRKIEGKKIYATDPNGTEKQFTFAYTSEDLSIFDMLGNQIASRFLASF